MADEQEKPRYHNPQMTGKDLTIIFLCMLFAGIATAIQVHFFPETTVVATTQNR